jgi:hypothetical protein
MIDADNTGQVAIDERKAAGVEDLVIVDDAVWRVQRWEVIVEGNAARIKDVVMVVTGGGGSARMENVVAAAARVVHEGVATAEATGIGATGDNAIAVKNVASGIVNDVAVANVVSPKIRKRTAVADAASIGATGVTACTVAAGANLVSVINVVIANIVAVVDTVGSAVVEGEVVCSGR